MCERINTGRQGELDVAKALAIPYMVIVHVYEEMSVVDYGARPDSLLRGVIEFLGGPLAAPVFMFAMGVGMVYTRHRNPRAFALRGLRLLLAGYLLFEACYAGVLSSQVFLGGLQGLGQCAVLCAALGQFLLAGATREEHGSAKG